MEILKEGFRFRPTDEEAIIFLLRFVAGEVMNDGGFITTSVDTYSQQLDPWDIYRNGVPCGNEDEENDFSQYRYFITQLKKKSESRYNRNVGNKGSWKQNLSKPVRKNGGLVIGYKKSMFYVNKGYDRQNGHWLMKEYELSTKILDNFDNDRRDYVLCAVKKITPAKDSNKLVKTPSPECATILEGQTPVVVECMTSCYDDTLQGVMEYGQTTNLEQQIPVAVESTCLDDNLQGGVMEYMQTTNLEQQIPVAVESTCLDDNLQRGGVTECVQISTNPSEAVLKLASFCEAALQGGGVVDAELQRNSLDLLDFDYTYVAADFDCLRSITTSLDNY